MGLTRQAGFRVWTRGDIEGMVAALDQASGDVATAMDSYEMQLYRQGYLAALRSMAQMFGLDYAPAPHRRPLGSPTIDGIAQSMS